MHLLRRCLVKLTHHRGSTVNPLAAILLLCLRFRCAQLKVGVMVVVVVLAMIALVSYWWIQQSKTSVEKDKARSGDRSLYASSRQSDGADPTSLGLGPAFAPAKPAAICDNCGKPRSTCNHVWLIQKDQPPWLPVDFRRLGRGEYTFHCTRCDSFPNMKWPSDFGATSAMTIHLSYTHHVGNLRGFDRPQFNMIKVQSQSD